MVRSKDSSEKLSIDNSRGRMNSLSVVNSKHDMSLHHLSNLNIIPVYRHLLSNDKINTMEPKTPGESTVENQKPVAESGNEGNSSADLGNRKNSSYNIYIKAKKEQAVLEKRRKIQEMKVLQKESRALRSQFAGSVGRNQQQGRTLKITNMFTLEDLRERGHDYPVVQQESAKKRPPNNKDLSFVIGMKRSQKRHSTVHPQPPASTLMAIREHRETRPDISISSDKQAVEPSAEHSRIVAKANLTGSVHTFRATPGDTQQDTNKHLIFIQTDKSMPNYHQKENSEEQLKMMKSKYTTDSAQEATLLPKKESMQSSHHDSETAKEMLLQTNRSFNTIVITNPFEIKRFSADIEQGKKQQQRGNQTGFAGYTMISPAGGFK